MNPNTTLIAVAGGKGGVGKSVFAANFACALLNELRTQVLLIDADSKSVGDQNVIMGLKPNKTIKEIQTALVALNTTINKLNNGNGTAAKLLNDPVMYTQLQSTIKSVNTLVDDIKVHPKRYVSISVFGKKDKSTPLAKPLSDTVAHD